MFTPTALLDTSQVLAGQQATFHGQAATDPVWVLPLLFALAVLPALLTEWRYTMRARVR